MIEERRRLEMMAEQVKDETSIVVTEDNSSLILEESTPAGPTGDRWRNGRRITNLVSEAETWVLNFTLYLYKTEASRPWLHLNGIGLQMSKR